MTELSPQQYIVAILLFLHENQNNNIIDMMQWQFIRCGIHYKY